MALVNLVGQDSAIRILESALRGERLSHAYLFVGLEGVGKRTAALALAKTLLCEGGDPVSSCGSCRGCSKVEEEIHPDLRIERGEKGSIPIEAVRDIQRWLASVPLEGENKIVIFDSAEQMTRGGANALLKTLEEPPVHALLILLAPTTQSVLPTIASRCQKVHFRALSEEELRRELSRRGVSPEEADSLIPLSQGSLGRALELRDQAEPFRDFVLDFLSTKRSKTERLDRCEEFFREGSHRETKLCWLSLVVRDLLLLSVLGEEIVQLKAYLPQLEAYLQSQRRGAFWESIDALGELYRALEFHVAPRLAFERYLYRVESFQGEERAG